MQTTVQKAASPKALADMFLTEPRFQQGIMDGCQGVLDQAALKTFVDWVTYLTPSFSPFYGQNSSFF